MACFIPIWAAWSTCSRAFPRSLSRELKMLRRSILKGAASLLLAAVPFVAAGKAMSTTPLHQAAGKNDAAAIKKLLAAGAEIDARDADGRTALLVATHGNRFDAAGALIEAGADVNAKDRIEDSPYLYAGARGHLDILKMTLAHG